MGSKGDICKVTSFLSFERFCFPKKWVVPMVLCIAGKLAGAIFLLIVYGIDWVKKEVFLNGRHAKNTMIICMHPLPSDGKGGDEINPLYVQRGGK